MLPDDPAIIRLFDRYLSGFLALLLGFTRIYAVLQIFPLFTATNVRGGLRAALAIVLALPLIPVIEPQVAALNDLNPTSFGLLVAKEFLVGILLGGLLSVPLWGVQTAGDLIDATRGASAANLSDPVNASEQSVTGTVLLYAALGLFILVDGFRLLASFIYDSYAVARPGEFLPPVGMELVAATGMLLGKLFTIGIVVSGPAMIALFIIDISLVFSSRIARQIPVNDFSTLIKNLCVAAFLPLYGVFLQQYMLSDWRAVTAFLQGFLRLDGG